MGNSRDRLTVDELRKEVEEWRKNRPKTKSFISFFSDPVDRAGGARTLLILPATMVMVPIIELTNLLLIRPVLATLHTIIVILATFVLRFFARPLIRIGCWAIRGKDKGIRKSIYSMYPGFLHLTVVVFGPSLRRYLRIDPSDIRSAGSFQEWIDDTLGVEGIWVESDVSRAVRHETWCPFVDHGIPLDPTCKGKYDPSYRDNTSCVKGCPEYCSVFMRGWLNDFLKSVNPEFEVEPMRHLMPNGDEYCEMVYVTKRTRSTDSEVKP